jgi:hypothetical protein
MSARRWSDAFNVLLKMFAVTLAIALVLVVMYPPKDHQGAPGPTGAQGVEGKAGADGEDGEKGGQGDKGSPGKDGQTGATGAKGNGFWGNK